MRKLKVFRATPIVYRVQITEEGKANYDFALTAQEAINLRHQIKEIVHIHGIKDIPEGHRGTWIKYLSGHMYDLYYTPHNYVIRQTETELRKLKEQLALVLYGMKKATSHQKLLP